MGTYVAFMHVFFKRPETPHPAIVGFKHWTVRVKDDISHDKILQVFKKAFQQAHPNWEILKVSLHEHPPMSLPEKLRTILLVRLAGLAR